ncbi:hypothetical protein AAY473_015213 [Plecturocebus cupreus]
MTPNYRNLECNSILITINNPATLDQECWSYQLHPKLTRVTITPSPTTSFNPPYNDPKKVKIIKLTNLRQN